MLGNTRLRISAKLKRSAVCHGIASDSLRARCVLPDFGLVVRSEDGRRLSEVANQMLSRVGTSEEVGGRADHN